MGQFEDNLKRIAVRVWKYGETEFKGQGCLCSSDFNDGEVDDPIIDKLNVTHYDRKWERKGKTVRLSFYEGDAFGACVIEGEPKVSVLVDVEAGARYYIRRKNAEPPHFSVDKLFGSALLYRKRRVSEETNGRNKEHKA